MPFDAPVLARVCQEISRVLPLKISKIFQPHRDEFLFTGYGQGENLKLLISLNRQFPRLHLFDGFRENPATPSSFCMLLRKYFGGAKLIAIKAVPFERIAQLVFETYDEFSGLSQKSLWLELTGKTANLIVADASGLIIDAWRRTKPVAGEREVNAGNAYEPPSTKGRWQPVSIELGTFVVLLEEVPETTILEQFLLKQWYGLSTLAISEICRRASLEPTTRCREITSQKAGDLFTAFSDFASLVAAGSFTPICLYDSKGTPIDCWSFPVSFPQPGIQVISVTDLNQTVMAIFNRRHELFRFNELKQGLLRQLDQKLLKNRTKLSKQEAEAAAAEKGDQWRIFGELLVAYGHGISKGANTAMLFNHYDPEGGEIPVPLNPALSVQENAQHYFKKYHKSKKGQLAIAAQIAKTQAEVDYLESLETLIINAETVEDLHLIQEEITPAKSSGIKNQGRPGKKTEPAKPREFLSPTGHQLLVGRNNIMNDRLTFKTASPNDWWFHTQKIPGSHVILRPNPGVKVDDASLNCACQLAVYYSKARGSSKVPVDYTQRKFVKKPPAAKPGFVIYENFKTAIITPEPTILKEFGIE